MDQVHLTTFFVHFPISLILVSTTLYAVAAIFRSHTWAKDLFITSKWNLYVAALVSSLALLSGWGLDPALLKNEGYQSATENHKFWGLLTAVAIIVYAIASILMRKIWGKKHIAVTMVSLIVLGCLVIVTGKFGLDKAQYIISTPVEDMTDSEEAEEYAPLHTEGVPLLAEEVEPGAISVDPEEDEE